MRRPLGIVLALATALLVACGSSDSTRSSDARSAATPSPTTDAPTTSAQPAATVEPTVDPLTVYFQQVEFAKVEFDSRLPNRFAVAGGVSVGIVLNTLEPVRAALIRLDSDLAEIDVPADFDSEHGEVVRTLIARIAALDALIVRLEAEPRDSLAQQIAEAGPELRAAGNALCVIGAAAADHDVEIVLGCNVDELPRLRRIDRPAGVLVSGESACSVHTDGASDVSTIIDFANTGGETINVHRIDGSGDRLFTIVLSAGQEHVQMTFVGAAWLVTDSEDRCLGSYVAPTDGTRLPIDAHSVS